MSTDIIPTLVGIAVLFWHGLQHSAFFFLAKLFLGIYTVVTFADLVMLLLLHDFRASIQKQRFGGRRPLIQPMKFLKRWEAIKARTQSDNPSYYKAAILEADALADEMLGEIGYEGGNIGERLSLIMPGQLLSAERLQEAHKVRNRIIREPDFTLPKEETDELLAFYESFFKELELL
ncbi:MAG: hypothetical protein HGB18_02010 [Candidatus Moranbacteria bacterium]|nr:hypothetical protein [Candidatus Moranbacteria bacterium]